MTLEKQELDRIEAAKAAIGTAIAGKGVAVPSGTKLDGMAALIDGIEAGGEDVSAETAEYTSLLTDLEAAVDALPDAGSGGGSGGSVETCTVEIISKRNGSSSSRIKCYIGSKIVDGEVEMEYLPYDGNTSLASVSLNNMICGSALMITLSGTTAFYSITAENCEYIGNGHGSGTTPVCLFKLPETSGKATIITNYED